MLIASLSHLYGQQFPQEQVGYLHQGDVFDVLMFVTSKSGPVPSRL